MTSLFDSAVYERRKYTPWAKIDVQYFLADLAQNGEGSPSLQVSNRPAVSTRLWWVLTWVSVDGEEHRTEAQTMELCLWRAAEMETRIRKRCSCN